MSSLNVLVCRSDLTHNEDFKGFYTIECRDKSLFVAVSVIDIYNNGFTLHAVELAINFNLSHVDKS